MNWKDIWMTLFGTADWLGLNMPFCDTTSHISRILLMMNVL